MSPGRAHAYVCPRCGYATDGQGTHLVNESGDCPEESLAKVVGERFGLDAQEQAELERALAERRELEEELAGKEREGLRMLEVTKARVRSEGNPQDTRVEVYDERAGDWRFLDAVTAVRWSIRHDELASLELELVGPPGELEAERVIDVDTKREVGREIEELRGLLARPPSELETSFRLALLDRVLSIARLIGHPEDR